MFSRRPKEPLPDFSDVHVKLKSILGVKPGVYLTVLYGIIILFILFMVLFFPGIKAYGTYVEFHTNPEKAAIWVDGTYRGVTPCTFLVPAGNHLITFKKSFYNEAEIEEDFRGRLLGTLFFPIRKRIDTGLAVEDLEGLIAWSLKDFIEWAMLKKFSHYYQLPPILTEAVQSLRNMPDNRKAEAKESLYALIRNAAYFVDSPVELRELLRSIFYLESGGDLFSSPALDRAIDRILSFAREHNSFFYWLIHALPSSGRLPSGSKSLTTEDITVTAAFSVLNRKFLTQLQSFTQYETAQPSGKPFMFQGLHFIPVPGGKFISGRYEEGNEIRLDSNFPYPTTVPSFFMAASEITNRQFSFFIAENPYWSKSNLDQLIGDKLVTERYLQEWKSDRYPEGRDEYPVANVSHYAALAFCNWLNSKTTPVPGFYARLPYEEEWERAVEWTQATATAAPAATDPEDAEDSPVFRDSGVIRPHNGDGIDNLLGNVWEWCANWYLPAKNLLVQDYTPTPGLNSHIIGVERVVKGGSWANDRNDIFSFTRGSQPPAWCTPYLGFRVVFARQ